MDCQTVREKIDLYIDGVLSSADSESFLAHVESCQDCKKELEDMLRLHKALRSLGEVEPPLGLAEDAARKARKRRGIPIAYISVGVAAALALTLVVTNAILPRYNSSTDNAAAPESYSMAAPADTWGGVSEAASAPAAAEEALVSQEALAEDTDLNGSMMSDAAEATGESAEFESGELPQEEQFFIMTAPAPSCIVTVSARDERQSDVRALLEAIIEEYGIEAIFLSDDAMDTISFVVPEAVLEDIIALTADFMPEGEIIANAVIEFRFVK